VIDHSFDEFSSRLSQPRARDQAFSMARRTVCAWPPFGASKPNQPLMCTSEVRLISTYVTRHASHKNKMMFIAVAAKQTLKVFCSLLPMQQTSRNFGPWLSIGMCPRFVGARPRPCSRFPILGPTITEDLKVKG
jgi:hypothetical protein